MQRTDTWFLLLAALCLVTGVTLGVVMGVTHDFSLRPVHAHLNLLGWTTLALFGLAYRGWPELGRSWLAVAHLILSGAGAMLMPAGIWIAMTHQWSGPVLVGSVMALAGALLFLARLIGLVMRG